MHVLLGHSTRTGRDCVRGSFGFLVAGQHLRPRLFADHEVDKRERIPVRLPLYRVYAQIHRVPLADADDGVQRQPFSEPRSRRGPIQGWTYGQL